LIVNGKTVITEAVKTTNAIVQAIRYRESVTALTQHYGIQNRSDNAIGIWPTTGNRISRFIFDEPGDLSTVIVWIYSDHDLVPFVSLAVAVSCGDVRTSTFVDGAKTVANATGIQGPNALVDIVTGTVVVVVCRASSATLSEGV